MHRIIKIIQVLALMLVAGTAATAEVTKITPDQARAQARAGELVLIDIRRPEEWTQTGVPDVSLMADFTQRDFIQKLTAIRAQSPDIPLAFICRTGNRSGYVTGELEKMGWTGIIDVVGGMAGSRVDQGWAKRGLPVRTATAPVNPEITITLP